MRKWNEIELINQVNDKTCVAACLAMVTGKTLGAVVNEMYKAGFKPPYGEHEYCPYLVRNNILPEVYQSATAARFSWETVNLVITASKNLVAKTHLIVLVYGEADGGVKVFDPQQGREGKDHYTIEEWEDAEIPWGKVIELTDCALPPEIIIRMSELDDPEKVQRLIDTAIPCDEEPGA